MTLYKVLDADGCSCNGGNLRWSLPERNKDGSWTPGEWMPEIEGPLVRCKNGYHLATLEQLVDWLNARIFVAETDGELIGSSDQGKWVARRVRLVSETGWNERTARLFAADCAERVPSIYEQDYPDDPRPRAAIETTRKFANGEATQEELDAARDAAGAAARDAASVSARDAAAAAGAAAGAAAWDSSWAAARAATRAATLAAAWDSSWAAARAAERKWQVGKLAEYLEVR